MITGAAPNAASLLSSHPLPSSASVVVVADLGRLLRDSAALAEVRTAVDALARCDAHLVLCSDAGADEMMMLERHLGLRHPFICERGAAVHIPRGFFCGDMAVNDAGWEVIEFGTPRLGHAVRLVVSLYQAAGTKPLVVALGEEWRHRALLREADSPIVLRNSALDQTSLVRSVPSAYVTNAEGARGFVEAILGHSCD